VVDDLPVQLLRHPLIEAAVPRFHVEDGDLPTFRRDDAEAGVGVAVDQDGIGALLLEHGVKPGDDERDGLGDGPSHRIQVVIGLGDVELTEEDRVELVVVVLTRMHQHMVGVAGQLRDDTAQLDELRPRARKRHHPEAGAVFGDLRRAMRLHYVRGTAKGPVAAMISTLFACVVVISARWATRIDFISSHDAAGETVAVALS
jgi:hypothetical protein